MARLAQFSSHKNVLEPSLLVGEQLKEAHF